MVAIRADFFPFLENVMIADVYSLSVRCYCVLVVRPGKVAIVVVVVVRAHLLFARFPSRSGRVSVHLCARLNVSVTYVSHNDLSMRTESFGRIFASE